MSEPASISSEPLGPSESDASRRLRFLEREGGHISASRLSVITPRGFEREGGRIAAVITRPRFDCCILVTVITCKGCHTLNSVDGSIPDISMRPNETETPRRTAPCHSFLVTWLTRPGCSWPLVINSAKFMADGPPSCLHRLRSC